MVNFWFILGLFIISLTHLAAVLLGVWIAYRLQEKKSPLPQIIKKKKPIIRTDKEEYLLERKRGIYEE